MNRPRKKSKGNFISALMALPWQVNLLLAVVTFLATKWLVIIPFQNPSIRMAATLLAVFAAPMSVSFVFFAFFSLLKKRNSPKSSALKNPLGQTASAAKNQSQNVWSIELLQQIEWKLFEDLSAAFYQEKGIRAELTKLGADGGIDIKLFQDDSGKPTSLVQCKAWNSKQVGVKEIREFLGVMTHEKIAKGFYMASGIYSIDAKEFAKSNGITLIDGVMLLAMITRLPNDAQKRLLDLVTEGDYTIPTCPSCGVKMLKRQGKHGEFWGCQNYPKCRQIMVVKKS